MRSDYALYMVAIIFFILTGISALILVESERPLWIVTTAVLGFFFVGLGYTQRPKLHTKPVEAPPITPAPVTPTPQPPTEIIVEEKPVQVVEVAPPKLELTEVKGIGNKRAEQLKALGINSIEDLAKASAKDLATNLKISPKITEKWITSAKELAEKQ